MGSCVSKKAARAGARAKAAAPLPAAEKETARALPPVAEVVDEEEEEVKEVVLSEPPRLPPPEPVERRQPEADADEESAPSEACSASDGGASVESSGVAKEKAKAKAKLMHKLAGAEPPEAEKMAPRKGRTPPDEREGKATRGGAGNARARSPSPSSAHRRQLQQPPPAPRPRREQPPVVSGFGCRSGRFSPSAARRAAESAAVRRTHSAREADMALPSKRSLSAAINGGSAVISKRDAGERSGRRSDSPTTGRRGAPASPGATSHRAASPMRKAAKEHGHGTPERARPRGRDGDEQLALAKGGEGDRKKGEEGALGQNPSVAMECFIFL